MKVKKLFALILAAVLAVSVLTACGGGSGGSLDIGEVNELIQSVGVDLKVGTNSNLSAGVRAATSALKKETTFNPSMAFAAMRNLLTIPYEIVSIGTYSETAIQSGAYDASDVAGLGVVNTPEKIVAVRAIRLQAEYGDAYTYSASASKTVNAAGTTVWVIAILVH